MKVKKERSFARRHIFDDIDLNYLSFAQTNGDLLLGEESN